jgi:hypothetical protein
MMSPFQAYKTYSALKLHFTSNYNYFQYNGQTKLKPESFEKRNDKIFFAKIAKHIDPVNFLMINLLDNPKAWIRTLAYDKQAEVKYTDWLKRKQSMTYMFKQDLQKLNPDFNSNLVVEDNTHPKIVVQYLSNEIMFETLCIICAITGCIKYWNKKMMEDPVWDELSRKSIKYMPFMDIDTVKYKKIILDTFKMQD